MARITEGSGVEGIQSNLASCVHFIVQRPRLTLGRGHVQWQRHGIACGCDINCNAVLGAVRTISGMSVFVLATCQFMMDSAWMAITAAAAAAAAAAAQDCLCCSSCCWCAFMPEHAGYSLLVGGTACCNPVCLCSCMLGSSPFDLHCCGCWLSVPRTFVQY
jgi:hypothetical protein